MKLGVYQCAAAGRTAEERLTVLKRHIAGQDCDLVLCPELFLSGYRPGAAQLAEAPNGPFYARLAELARTHGTAIAYGYPERAGDRLYNSALLIGADGAVLANHRKRLPSPQSFEETTFTNGESVTFADMNGIRIAMIICYEVEFPESLRQAAQGGAHLVLVPTALGAQWGLVAEKLVPTRAFENGVWLAYADHAGAEDELAFYGGSRIVAPDGAEVAAEVGTETLITAEISRNRVESAQARLPYLRDCENL